MIIGKGMIARAIRSIDNDHSLFFASGVSNSLETAPQSFQREADLLEYWLHYCQKKTFVFHYFSTTGVENLTTKSRSYFHHKKRMEEIILDSASIFQKKIYRLPNMVGPSTNPHTLTNFIHSSLLKKNFEVLQMEAQRELLDVELLSPLILENSNNAEEIVRLNGIRCTVANIVDAFKRAPTAPKGIQSLICKYYNDSDSI